MQIHELNSFVGSPTSTDYLAIDDGEETKKISLKDAVERIISNNLPSMTQAEAEAGSVTADRVVTPSVFKAAILAVARTITDTWVDISAAKVNLNTSAASGTDHDLYVAITALGWQSDVIE